MGCGAEAHKSLPRHPELQRLNWREIAASRSLSCQVVSTRCPVRNFNNGAAAELLRALVVRHSHQLAPGYAEEHRDTENKYSLFHIDVH